MKTQKNRCSIRRGPPLILLISRPVMPTTQSTPHRIVNGSRLRTWKRARVLRSLITLVCKPFSNGKVKNNLLGTKIRSRRLVVLRIEMCSQKTTTKCLDQSQNVAPKRKCYQWSTRDSRTVKLQSILIVSLLVRNHIGNNRKIDKRWVLDSLVISNPFSTPTEPTRLTSKAKSVIYLVLLTMIHKLDNQLLG